VVTPCVITAADQPPDVPILGTGFTPNSPLTVKTDGYQANVDAPRADAAGAVTYQLRTPVGEFGADHPIKLEVVDAAGVSAATTFLMVYRSPAFPERTKTGARVTVSAYGFPVGRPVYVFYEYRGIVRTAVRLGIAAAPCGRVSRRIRILPAHAGDGVWRVGAASSPNPARSVYVHRLRKAATNVRSLGEE
jgi:hypothetical protein